MTETANVDAGEPNGAVPPAKRPSRYVVLAAELKYGNEYLKLGDPYPDDDPSRDYAGLLVARAIQDLTATPGGQAATGGRDPEVLAKLARHDIQLEAIEDGIERILTTLDAVLELLRAQGVSEPAKKRSQ